MGARFTTAVKSPAAWCPVSLVPYRNGRTGVFPHIMDRAKPGSIGVRADGKRFVNEANGYYDYVEALLAATPEGETVESWQIADSRFVRKFPLGNGQAAARAALPVPALRLPHQGADAGGIGDEMWDRPHGVAADRGAVQRQRTSRASTPISAAAKPRSTATAAT